MLCERIPSSQERWLSLTSDGVLEVLARNRLKTGKAWSRFYVDFTHFEIDLSI